MIRRPPGSTRTVTPFPYTTLVRSMDIILAADPLPQMFAFVHHLPGEAVHRLGPIEGDRCDMVGDIDQDGFILHGRSEEHTSELQSLMRLSYAVFCLKKKNKHNSH